MLAGTSVRFKERGPPCLQGERRGELSLAGRDLGRVALALPLLRDDALRQRQKREEPIVVHSYTGVCQDRATARDGGGDTFASRRAVAFSAPQFLAGRDPALPIGEPAAHR